MGDESVTEIPDLVGVMLADWDEVMACLLYQVNEYRSRSEFRSAMLEGLRTQLIGFLAWSAKQEQRLIRDPDAPSHPQMDTLLDGLPF